jgi:Tfp pilus assembly protein PilP
MWRFLPLLLLAGCSQGAQSDLQYIKQARSAAAEWALVNEQAVRGQLTDAYVKTMREEARTEIESASSSLSQPNSPSAREITSLSVEPDDAAPEQLRGRAEALKRIEDSLESA